MRSCRSRYLYWPAAAAVSGGVDLYSCTCVRVRVCMRVCMVCVHIRFSCNFIFFTFPSDFCRCGKCGASFCGSIWWRIDLYAITRVRGCLYVCGVRASMSCVSMCVRVSASCMRLLCVRVGINIYDYHIASIRYWLHLKV